MRAYPCLLPAGFFVSEDLSILEAAPHLWSLLIKSDRFYLLWKLETKCFDGLSCPGHFNEVHLSLLFRQINPKTNGDLTRGAPLGSKTEAVGSARNSGLNSHWAESMPIQNWMVACTLVIKMLLKLGPIICDQLFED